MILSRNYIAANAKDVCLLGGGAGGGDYKILGPSFGKMFENLNKIYFPNQSLLNRNMLSVGLSVKTAKYYFQNQNWFSQNLRITIPRMNYHS